MNAYYIGFAITCYIFVDTRPTLLLTRSLQQFDVIHRHRRSDLTRWRRGLEADDESSGGNISHSCHPYVTLCAQLLKLYFVLKGKQQVKHLFDASSNEPRLFTISTGHIKLWSEQGGYREAPLGVSQWLLADRRAPPWGRFLHTHILLSKRMQVLLKSLIIYYAEMPTLSVQNQEEFHNVLGRIDARRVARNINKLMRMAKIRRLSLWSGQGRRQLSVPRIMLD